MRRGVAFLLALTFLFAPLTGVASAHNGKGAAFKGAAGPFTVLAFDGRLSDEPGAAEYRVVISRNGAPVDTASVSAVAELLDIPHQRVGPLLAKSTANIYSFRLPDHGPVPWRVRLTVRDDALSGTATYETHSNALQPSAAIPPATGGGGTRNGLVVATVFGVLLVILAAVIVRRSAAARTDPVQADRLQ